MPNETADLNRSMIPAVASVPLIDDEELKFRQVLELLRSGRWTIALIVAAAFLLGLIYVVIVAPTYQADGIVQVEEDTKSGSLSQMSDISSLLLGTPVETEAEIQLLQSRMVLNQVIDKMNLLVDAEPIRLPIIGAAFGRWNRAASEPVKVPSFIRSYAWGGERTDVSRFEVPAELQDQRFRLQKTEQGYTLFSPEGEKLLEGKIGEIATIDNQLGHFSLFVRELVARPGTQFALIRYSRQDVLTRILKKLIVQEEGKQSGVISLTFEGSSPEFVTGIVNNIEEAYLRQNVERRSEDAQKSLEFLQTQLPQLKAQVDAAQARLNDYQTRHGSVDVTQETQLVLQESVDLEAQRLGLEQQRDEAMQRFTAEHPVVKALNQQVESLDTARSKIKQKVENLPTTQQEVFSLMRDLDVDTQLYTAMLNSVQELQISKAGTVGNVRIVDSALQPFKPIRPKVLISLLLSVIFGAVLGCGFVFVQRALLRGVDDPAEIEARFGLTTYAMIPYSKEQRRLSQDLTRSVAGNYLLSTLYKDSVTVEALRSLRTSLHFALLEAPNNIVMFTGPSPGLGKSFISINLGVILAQSGKRVVVVDADLRRGHLNQYVSKPATPGVSDFVVGDTELPAITLDSGIEGLSIVPRGTHPPNPAELLLHERFAQLLKTLSAAYDFVFVDTPPVLPVTDAAIVGRLAGCTLLVLKSAEHPISEIDAVLKRLGQAGVNVKGVLFNLVGARLGSYGYDNYGYTYYKYEK